MEIRPATVADAVAMIDLMSGGKKKTRPVLVGWDLRVSFQFQWEDLPVAPVIFSGRHRPLRQIRIVRFPRRDVGAAIIRQPVQVGPVRVIAVHR